GLCDGRDCPFKPIDGEENKLRRQEKNGMTLKFSAAGNIRVYLFRPGQVNRAAGKSGNLKIPGRESGLKHKEMFWRAGDGLQLFAQSWEPAEEVKGVICLVHGLGEHSGRYRHWAELFNRSGYAVLATDLRGHGQSAGARGH